MTDAEKKLRAELTKAKWRRKLSKAIYERINEAPVESVSFSPEEWRVVRLAVARSIGVDDLQIHNLRQKIEELKKAEKEAEK